MTAEKSGIDIEALDKLLMTPIGELAGWDGSGGSGSGQLLRERVAALYVIPNHHNPCGYHYALHVCFLLCLCQK